MAIPLLEITPKTQNQRVAGYDVLDEDDPIAYRSTDTDVNELIWAGYRQIFSEHLILESYRQPFLESQLRNGAISVREFIRGLGKSDVYRRLVAEKNSNYRLVDITFKRFLGRASYDRDEQIAWSIVIATKGLPGFIDAIVDGDEYRQNFGDTIVPYQRRRLEGRPFNLVTPSYSDYWRNRMGEFSGSSYQVQYRTNSNKLPARQAIPSAFLSMAQSLVTPQLDTQRHVARATSSAVKIPHSTRKAVSQATVKPKEVALPYRYLPGTTKI